LLGQYDSAGYLRDAARFLDRGRFHLRVKRQVHDEPMTGSGQEGSALPRSGLPGVQFGRLATGVSPASVALCRKSG
jgi:hypothetical protein